MEENINDLISMAISFHWIFIVTVILIIAYNIFIVLKEDEYVKLANKTEFIAPQYYVILTALAFTGIIAWTVQNFYFDLKIILMIIGWLVIIILSIKKQIVFKRMRRQDIDTQLNYKKFAKKKYTIDLLIMLFIVAMTYIL